MYMCPSDYSKSVCCSGFFLCDIRTPIPLCVIVLVTLYDVSRNFPAAVLCHHRKVNVASVPNTLREEKGALCLGRRLGGGGGWWWWW
jgi:hypothetical protein